MIVDIDIEKIFDKLFALTRSFAKEISRDFTIDILRMYKKGENPISVLYAMLDVIQIQVIDAMVAAHLEGYLRSVMRASEHLVKPTAFSGFDNAVKFAKDRLKLSKTNIAVLKQRYGATAINATMGMGEVVEKRIKKALSEIVERNYHIKQGMTHLSAAVKKAGISGTNPWMIETMVRTNIHIAYGAGRWDANQDSAIQAILWGYEYITVGDFRVRPEHEMLEGVTLPKEDPQWSQIWPPNGFNCRCDVLEIYKDETRRQKIKEIPQPQLIQGHLVTPGPDEGWAINHGQVFTSDIAKSADEIRAIVAEGIAKGDTMFITDRFGKTHEVRMQWISSGPPTPSNLARWNKEFEAITKKPAWMQKIDKLVAQGKTPQWSSKFWSPKRAEYFEFASKRVSGVKIPVPTVKITPSIPAPVSKKPLAIPEKIAKDMKLKGLKESYREEIEKAYVELRMKYPRIKCKIRLQLIKYKGYPSDEIAVVEVIKGTNIHVIQLNSTYFSKEAMYNPRAITKKCYKKGYFSSEGLKGTVQHEFGHALLDQHSEKMRNKAFDIFMDATSKQITKKISKYGSKNYHEMFAEAFSQHMQNKGSALTKKLISLIKTKSVPIKEAIRLKPAAITSHYLKALKPKWMQNIDAMVAKGKPPNWKAPFWQKYKHHRDYYKAITGKKMPKGFVKIKAGKVEPIKVKRIKAPRLNYEEEDVIVNYTSDSYRELNRTLRNKTGRYKKDIQELVNVLDKLPDTKGTVYRGLTETVKNMDKLLKTLKKGKTIRFKSFLSSSRSHRFAKSWGTPSEEGAGILFNIESKTGKFIGKYSTMPRESEVLFKPNSEFKVLKIISNPQRRATGKEYEIYLKEVA